MILRESKPIDIVGEGELTVQHAYIDGGDIQLPPRPHAGLAGAQFERSVAELLKKLEHATAKLPEHAPYPVKLKISRFRTSSKTA